MTSQKLNETLTDTFAETLNWHPKETLNETPTWNPKWNRKGTLKEPTWTFRNREKKSW